MTPPTFTHGIFTFTLRPATETDLAYILDTWLEGMAPEYRDVRKSDYERDGRLHILGILQRPGVGVVVASPVDEPTVIWAYIVAEAGLIHWCYVRKTHRRLGIARRLVNAILPEATPPLVISHLTAVVRKIKSKHRDLFRYLPWRGETNDQDATGPEADPSGVVPGHDPGGAGSAGDPR